MSDFQETWSIFSKRLTLPWSTAIVTSWLNSSTSISRFIFFLLDIKYTTKLEMGRRGGCPYFVASSTFFPFPDSSPNTQIFCTILQVRTGLLMKGLLMKAPGRNQHAKRYIYLKATSRKHSASGKQSSMCLSQKTLVYASVTFLHWGLKNII